MKDIRVIGVMSGTSLDGLDIACCTFTNVNNTWTYRVESAKTLAYSRRWMEKLANSHKASGESLAKTHVEYGGYIGEKVNELIKETSFYPDFIASHGHTVFHQPEAQFTLQIGDGNAIAARTNLRVICDFRSLDVALGGQGAPLVPIGDRLLFGEYAFCLNLGGFANISFENNTQRMAFDVCPANMLLNYLAGMLNLSYDKNGMEASQGKVDNALLDALNGLAYYKTIGVKTLGREWFEMNVLPLIKASSLKPGDLLATGVEHIARQVANSVNLQTGKDILVTGGGAHNKYLISRIRAWAEKEIIIPDETLVDFKEALVFAFLGVLRNRGEINCLASVTGAVRDSCTGVMIK